MVVLSFCVSCGDKKVKEVKQQLENLLSSKISSTSCCICNDLLTSVSPKVVGTHGDPPLVETKKTTIDNRDLENESSEKSDWMTVCLTTGEIKTEVCGSAFDGEDVEDADADSVSTKEVDAASDTSDTDDEGKEDDIADKAEDGHNRIRKGLYDEDISRLNIGMDVDNDCKNLFVDNAYFRVAAMRPEFSKLVKIVENTHLPYKCAICDVSKQFAGVNHLINHLWSHCANVNIDKEVLQNPYRCIDCCDMLFNTFGDWTRHTQLYQCRYPACRERFKSHGKLEEHERSSHSKTERAFKCGYCGKRFLTVQTRWGHVKKLHPSLMPIKVKVRHKDKRPTRQRAERQPNPPCRSKERHISEEKKTVVKPKVRQRTVFVLTEQQKAEDFKLQILALRPELKDYLDEDECNITSFPCKDCNHLKFPNFRRFCYHVCSQHLNNEDLLLQLFQCNECCDEKFTTFSQWKAHTKPYKCPVPGCDYGNALRTKLGEHNEIAHTNERSHKCSLCPLAFNQKQALSKHVKVVHEKFKRYTCSYCGFMFAAKSNLQNHERIHSNERPFHCDQCDRSFSTSCKLKVHKMDHTGEKPFVCDQCGFRTKTKPDLKSHVRIMHSGSQRQMFQCDICGIWLTTRSNMNKHLRKHTGEKKYKCRFCEEYFLYHDSRERHEKTHPEWKGVRRHVCQVCGKDLHSKYKLQVHMVIHSGVKPFKCPHCDYRSHRKSGLDAHVKKHEREKAVALMIQTGDIHVQPQEGNSQFMT